MSEIKEEIKKIGEELDSKLEHLAKENKTFGEEYKKEVKEYVDSQTKKFLELHEKANAEIQKRLDESEMASQKAGVNKSMDSVPGFQKSLESELFGKSDNLERFKAFTSGNSPKFKIDLKTVLTTGTNASGDVLPSQRQNQIYYDPTRAVRLRQIVATGTTDSARVRYIQESAYTNGAAMRNEAAAYASSGFTHTSVDADVESLGTIMTITKEMLEDHKLLRSYLNARVPEKVMDVEDSQILTGTGSAPQIQGLMASGGATAFDTASTAAFYQFYASGDVSPTEYDVLVAAINQIQLVNYVPDAIVLNPTDYHKIWLRKASDGQYTAYKDQAPLQIAGIPVFKSTAQTAGQFLVGNFRLGSQLFFRNAMTLEFSEQDSDNFQKDLITVKASERMTQAIWLPNAFAWGTFSTAISSLQA